MPISEQKATKIRAALTQLDPAKDDHWTDDGLPRENVVRDFANDQSVSRKDIQDAYPGFQRQAQKPAAEVDPLTGEPPVSDEAKAAYHLMRPPTEGEGLGLDTDPAKNTGDYMSDEEVRVVLEQRVKDAEQGIADAQANVRAANQAVIDAQAKLRQVKDDLTREFPPLTQAQNIKQYIASEMALRAAAHGVGPSPSGIAPGSQIDAAMQRSNSRGWRRPSRTGQVQTGAARRA